MKIAYCQIYWLTTFRTFPIQITMLGAPFQTHALQIQAAGTRNLDPSTGWAWQSPCAMGVGAPDGQAVNSATLNICAKPRLCGTGNKRIFWILYIYTYYIYIFIHIIYIIIYIHILYIHIYTYYIYTHILYIHILYIYILYTLDTCTWLYTLDTCTWLYMYIIVYI